MASGNLFLPNKPLFEEKTDANRNDRSGNEEYAAKLLSAMRYKFGSHKEKAADKQEAA
jgi:6-phosphogluconate dehydrogenase (decarboxylating)